MRDIKECKVYENDINRMTKGNSFVASGRVCYICKKSSDGKATKIYIAYDSASKIQLGAHHSKEYLTKYIQGKDLSVLGVDKSSLF